MDYKTIFKDIEKQYNLKPLKVEEIHPAEVYAQVSLDNFKPMCLAMHKHLRSAVMSFFANDRRKEKSVFELVCLFQSQGFVKWIFITTEIPKNKPEFESLSKDIYSASLFEREIREMFGINPKESPDTRRLRLHDEVWPEGNFPLRKDFNGSKIKDGAKSVYQLKKVEGEGVFEVPVGPVHAGIIAPGHFRFSVAGEPIINLEIRLGFVHRGVEKLFENMSLGEAVPLSECVVGDSAFAHSTALCNAAEKILKLKTNQNVWHARALFLELERMYNHANDIGGIAVDVGFSFPSAFASLMKESILALNEALTGSRYLKGVNTPGGILCGFDEEKKKLVAEKIKALAKDIKELKKMVLQSVSFMDRADTTGVLNRRTAHDLGVHGVAGRASGIINDLRKDFPGIYDKVKFNTVRYLTGDVTARLNVRFFEFEESLNIIKQLLELITPFEPTKPIPGLSSPNVSIGDPRSSDIRFPIKELGNDKTGKSGYALGYIEGWRGPVLYWLSLNAEGRIERCKIVDPSFRNWEGLAFAMPGNIVPDFPLCNKSFDLSYSGNDL